MLEKTKQRMRSDRGAVGTVETIMLIALAVFAVMAVTKFIIEPLSTTSEGVGTEIEAMNPNN